MDIGVIGVGYWGLNYLRVFSELKSCRVIKCSDLDNNLLDIVKEKYPLIQTCNNYEDISKDPKIKAVCVSTPASAHYEIVKNCLLNNKHVLVEKPFTIKSEEAEELIGIAREKKRVVMVGHTYLYNLSIKKLKDLIKSGEIGDVFYLYLSRTGLGPVRNDVNALWDLAPHDISIIIHLLGETPKRVSAVGQSYLQEGIEDVVFINLLFRNKVMANIHASWLDPYKIRSISIIGSKKMVVFNDIETVEGLKLFDKGVKCRTPHEYGEFRMTVREGDIYIPKIDTSEPLKNQCTHFLECISENKIPLTDGGNGLLVVKVLEAAQKSLEKGGKPQRV